MELFGCLAGWLVDHASYRLVSAHMFKAFKASRYRGGRSTQHACLAQLDVAIERVYGI